jgi:hypothetical protein
VKRQRAKGNGRASTSEPAAKAGKVFTAAGELERKRKAKGTTAQVAQLKELVHRLLTSHHEQKATQELQQKELAATIEPQTKTITKLEAKVQAQVNEFEGIRTLLQADKPGHQSYSDVLHRVPLSVNSTSTAAIIVDRVGPVTSGVGNGREQNCDHSKHHKGQEREARYYGHTGDSESEPQGVQSEEGYYNRVYPASTNGYERFEPALRDQPGNNTS